ncbi:MAG TPA: hypothetical protein VN369_03715, partial [Terriglobales bacterium]|nr:hypothetical protein [Terriglobales bacterium]
GNDMSSKEDYLSKIRPRFENNFEIAENAASGERPLAMTARCEVVSGRTFITPQDIIDKFELNETCYFYCCEELTPQFLLFIYEKLRSEAESFRPESAEHMSTTFTCIFICDRVTEEAAIMIKKHVFRKYYAFALKGWCDIRLIAVSVEDGQIFACRRAKPLRKVLTI